MEFQDRESRSDSLKLEFEEYLKKEKAKKRKKSRGQPPLAPQLEAPEADTLQEIDRAISENNNIQASGKRYTSNPPAGLISLPEIIKWIAQRCTNPHYVRCLYGDQDIVHEILHEAQGKDERKYHVKWTDTIVLRKHFVMFEKEGYKTESQRPLADDIPGRTYTHSLHSPGTVCSILEVEQAQAELHWDEAKAKMGISSHFSPSMFASKDTSSKP